MYEFYFNDVLIFNVLDCVRMDIAAIGFLAFYVVLDPFYKLYKKLLTNERAVSTN